MVGDTIFKNNLALEMTWRGDRVVHGAALEKRSPLNAERGFESHPLRVKKGRGAGVVYQARLESVCRLKRPWVRIPPSPPE